MSPVRIPARAVLAAVASALVATLLGAAGGCAGPYALPVPPAAPTMAFPSQESPPLPAYATPLDEAPVSVTLDGDVLPRSGGASCRPTADAVVCGEGR